MLLHPDLLLEAYANGFFPMSEDRHATKVFWVDPDFRGIIPLDHLHISHKLAKKIRQNHFQIRVDFDFPKVMSQCAEAQPGRWTTWINRDIVEGYCALHQRGHAHSVEYWSKPSGPEEEPELLGGLYGVAIGGAFFGESMFSRVPDASKVCLAFLVARLRFGGYQLLDTQFVTDHLLSMGAVEIARTDYQRLLQPALKAKATFLALPLDTAPAEILSLVREGNTSSTVSA